MGGWVDGWVDGWVGVKAVLRIAYSNQKFIAVQKLPKFLRNSFELKKFDNFFLNFICIRMITKQWQSINLN
jgi:hypothetical protein